MCPDIVIPDSIDDSGQPVYFGGSAALDSIDVIVGKLSRITVTDDLEKIDPLLASLEKEVGNPKSLAALEQLVRLYELAENLCLANDEGPNENFLPLGLFENEPAAPPPSGALNEAKYEVDFQRPVQITKLVQLLVTTHPTDSVGPLKLLCADDSLNARKMLFAILESAPVLTCREIAPLLVRVLAEEVEIAESDEGEFRTYDVVSLIRAFGYLSPPVSEALPVLTRGFNLQNGALNQEFGAALGVVSRTAPEQALALFNQALRNGGHRELLGVSAGIQNLAEAARPLLPTIQERFRILALERIAQERIAREPDYLGHSLPTSGLVIIAGLLSKYPEATSEKMLIGILRQSTSREVSARCLDVLIKIGLKSPQVIDFFIDASVTIRERLGRGARSRLPEDLILLGLARSAPFEPRADAELERYSSHRSDDLRKQAILVLFNSNKHYCIRQCIAALKRRDPIAVSAIDEGLEPLTDESAGEVISAILSEPDGLGSPEVQKHYQEMLDILDSH